MFIKIDSLQRLKILVQAGASPRSLDWKGLWILFGGGTDSSELKPPTPKFRFSSYFTHLIYSGNIGQSENVGKYSEKNLDNRDFLGVVSQNFKPGRRFSPTLSPQWRRPWIQVPRKQGKARPVQHFMGVGVKVEIETAESRQNQYRALGQDKLQQ